MVVTRRVPSPRSVRHLLQVALVLANIVGKRVLYVKHGWSASSRVRVTVRRDESLLERSNSVASDAAVYPRSFHSGPPAGGAPRRLPQFQPGYING